MNILLGGTGSMAKEYARVLVAQKIPFEVIGRSKQNCETFRSSFPGVRVFDGGLESFSGFEKYTHGIITTNVEFLAKHAEILIDHGIRFVLLEKPGGRNLEEIIRLSEQSSKANAQVIIAYNRRFYASVIEAQKRIKEDGGVLSFNFEFTEWPHVIEEVPNSEVARENLFFANSTHVVDLAFFLGGFPSLITTYATDSLKWHKKAIYAGAGMSETGALFSYSANWKGPGRWVVEIITANHRFYFKPMEQLHVQQQRSVKVEQVEIDDRLDKEFKPGLYAQVEAFLNRPEHPSLLTIQSQAQHCNSYYQVMLDGSK